VSDHVYRATAMVTVQVGSAEPMTRDQVVAAVQASLGLGIAIEAPAVSVSAPECIAEPPAFGHRCQAYADDNVHGPFERCRKLYGCEKPDDHHEYVSPGWDAPADDVITSATDVLTSLPF
jgi:hypothetical protein